MKEKAVHEKYRTSKRVGNSKFQVPGRDLAHFLEDGVNVKNFLRLNHLFIETYHMIAATVPKMKTALRKCIEHVHEGKKPVGYMCPQCKKIFFL